MTLTRLVVGAVIAGLVVLSVVLYLESIDAPRAARIVGYQTTGDTRKLVMVIEASLLTDVLERRVDEDAQSVRVTVLVRPPTGSVPAVAIILPVLITLREPLGDRAVLDRDGAAVPDRGPYRTGSP